MFQVSEGSAIFAPKSSYIQKNITDQSWKLSNDTFDPHETWECVFTEKC